VRALAEVGVHRAVVPAMVFAGADPADAMRRISDEVISKV
jgi:hypothetical protein